jgi:hypothetical protein
MRNDGLGWLSILSACFGIGVLWFLCSLAQFYLGWMRLDPMCVAHSPLRYPVYVFDNLYTVGAAAKLEKVIGSLFGKDAVYVDSEGVVHIKPALYYGYLDELDRLPQLVVRPEDEPHLYQRPGINCDELQQLVRSPIDMTKRDILKWPFSFYVLVLQPDFDTLYRWQALYRE